MSELQAEIDRIDAEIEVLQRVRARLAKQELRLKYFAADGVCETPAAPKAQPRQERGNGEPTPAILSVLKTLQQIQPATYGQLLENCTKGESTIHKAKRWMVQGNDKRWSLNEAGEEALKQNQG